jgi:hypothetical protein
MITIGIRAEPSAVTFAIYNSDTTNEIVNVEEIEVDPIGWTETGVT